ncbi:MAG: prepilin-type N-terminal cleavage/methylation domain-containing protein [Gammaproteobacteria bacterium]|nr:prepilin-type N-terminal cleavage/methylation domain-containing protein [Gammaproteobacteria bacterium]
MSRPYRHAGSRAAGTRGFTLIEVLLATVLLAAGLAVAFATLGAATKSTQRGEALAQQNERMRAVAGFLRGRIGSARPIAFAHDPDSGLPLRFLGEPDRVRFVADLPDYLGRGGPTLHELTVARDGDGLRLLVSFELVQSGVTLPEDPPRPPEPLAEDLTKISFRYRALDADGVLGEWQEQWIDGERPPLQVSVRIESRAGGVWPELVIALPMAAGYSQGIGSGASLR